MFFNFFFNIFFFFQAEDGIRDVAVTGVQTCALPISTFIIDENVLWLASKGRLISIPLSELQEAAKFDFQLNRLSLGDLIFDSKIGRASCRERV